MLIQFTLEEQQCLMTLVEAHLQDQFTLNELTTLIEHVLQPIFQSSGVIAGIGEIELSRIKLLRVMTINYPSTFLDSLDKITSVENRSLLSHWLEKQKPFYIQENTFQNIISVLEKKEMENFQLLPMLIHGQRDLSGKFASYFSFRQCKLQEERAKRLVTIYMPYLHQLLMKALDWQYNEIKETAIKLTTKEWQLVDYLKQGKTNKEIALEINRSPSTIKHQIQALFRKLAVSNRSEALAKIQTLSSPPIE